MTIQEYENLRSQNNNFNREEDREVLLTDDHTVIAIFGLIDPLRKEIVDSVKKCHRAGINIRMVTGDAIDTAKAIALEAGILTHEQAQNKFSCMTGERFREYCGGL
jgi:P-type E1-E2 ATPase